MTKESLQTTCTLIGNYRGPVRAEIPTSDMALKQQLRLGGKVTNDKKMG